MNINICCNRRNSLLYFNTNSPNCFDDIQEKSGRWSRNN